MKRESYHSLLGESLDLLDGPGSPLLEGDTVHLFVRPLAWLIPHARSARFLQDQSRQPKFPTASANVWTREGPF